MKNRKSANESKSRKNEKIVEKKIDERVMPDLTCQVVVHLAVVVCELQRRGRTLDTYSKRQTDSVHQIPADTGPAETSFEGSFSVFWRFSGNRHFSEKFYFSSKYPTYKLKLPHFLKYKRKKVKLGYF